jgi:hypothetical protein
VESKCDFIDDDVLLAVARDDPASPIVALHETRAQAKIISHAAVVHVGNVV